METKNQVLISDLVTVENNEPMTTSVRVAEFFEKDHSSVTRKIRELISQLKGIDKNVNTPYYEERLVVNHQNGEKYPQFLMDFDGFILLAMGFTGAKALACKLLYIAEFNRMREILRSGDVLPDKRDSIANLIVKSSRPQIQALKELYPEYFLGPAPSSNLELVVDKNTSYRNWIEDFNITSEWIGEFPTLDIYRSYSQYCIENHYIPMGKKVFYKTLEADFNLTRKQLSDGYRYFLTA